jgi:type II secretory pathway pseudopilin PulG
MRFGTAIDKPRNASASAFTLVEVLAALMFMAIVIPVAVDALRVASLAGEFAARKAEAVRVADVVLNESIVTTNWNSAANGTVHENGREYHYTLQSQSWPQDTTMQLVTAEVMFSAGGRQCVVRLNTLASLYSTGATNAVTGMP